MIMAGQKTLNILNLESGKMSVLVRTKTVARPGSSVIFITKDEHNGYVINWTNYHVDDMNKAHDEWFVLPLREDFMQCLRETGTTLPVTS